MPFLSTFITSVILAIAAAFALLGVIIPPGEGSFGIAKLAPYILVGLAIICFCLIWLPVNLIVWFTHTPEQRGKVTDAKPDFAFSGLLFMAAIAFCGFQLAPQWLHKVHFYYQLEDQFGHPVSGAMVRRHNDFTKSAQDAESESDAQGRFQETCKPGESFTLILRKQGYAMASLGLTGTYSEELRIKQKTAQGSNSLIVVKMWKLQGSEPLVGINQNYKLHYTNAPIYFDLIAGKIVPIGGDFKITVSRAPDIMPMQKKLDWNVEIEAVDGGLMDSAGTERVTYFAPESGYEPSRTIDSTDRLPEGGLDGFHTGFYVKSRNGQVYSKLGFSVRIDLKTDDFIYFEFRGLANTNGSRNWEADPNTLNPAAN
jgi:hypothetical protein